MKVTHKGEQPAKVSAEKAVIGNGLMMTGKLMVSIHPAVLVMISVVLKVESLGKYAMGFVGLILANRHQSSTTNL